MKIHLNFATPETLLWEARKIADVGTERCKWSGSRTHEKKADVILTGHSTHATNQRHGFHDEYTPRAASWDQWGIYLAVIFDQAPDTKTDYYADAGDFHRQTGMRFRRDLMEAPVDLVMSPASPAYQRTQHVWSRDFANGGLFEGKAWSCTNSRHAIDAHPCTAVLVP